MTVFFSMMRELGRPDPKSHVAKLLKSTQVQARRGLPRAIESKFSKNLNLKFKVRVLLTFSFHNSVGLVNAYQQLFEEKLAQDRKFVVRYDVISIVFWKIFKFARKIPAHASQIQALAS